MCEGGLALKHVCFAARGAVRSVASVSRGRVEVMVDLMGLSLCHPFLSPRGQRTGDTTGARMQALYKLVENRLQRNYGGFQNISIQIKQPFHSMFPCAFRSLC